MGLGVLSRPLLLLFRTTPGNRAVRPIQSTDRNGSVDRRRVRNPGNRRLRITDLPGADPVETVLEGDATLVRRAGVHRSHCGIGTVLSRPRPVVLLDSDPRLAGSGTRGNRAVGTVR